MGRGSERLRLDDVRGFMFDVDGTLLHRGADGRGHAQPRAVEVLERIRAGGRPLVLFTNASHVPSAVVAKGLRDDGLPVADEEVLTPTDSAIDFFGRTHPGARLVLFAYPSIRQRFEQSGFEVTEGEDGDAVFVAHLDHVEMDELERAARAVTRGASFFTASYVRGYAGGSGMIFSRGAMITAAIAKVTGVRPRVLGKPSRAAVTALGHRLGVPSSELAVIGDDLGMDIALGRMGGSRTILVRSGISGALPLSSVPERRRPDAVVDAVADLLPLL